MKAEMDRILDCLKAELPTGSRVYLFGSRAEGRAHEDSDFDLLVVEPRVGNRIDESARLSALLGWQRIAADVVVFDAATFERQRRIPNTLAWHVSRHGCEHGIEH